MIAGSYAPKSIATYMREVRYIIEYYPDQSPYEWKDTHITQYLHYLKTTFNVSKAKCRSVAQAVAFFFRHVLKRAYDIPSKLYPRKEFKLPSVLTREEVQALLGGCTSLKQRCIVELFYSSGLRLEELTHLKMQDIDSANKRIKVTKGKGDRQRYTILSAKLLEKLRKYYQQEKVKPQVYLFEGRSGGRHMHTRSIQHSVRTAYEKAGMADKTQKVHALRHSFATHMLDSGVDIHTIKELLGHSKIETSMVYLHLQTSKRNMLVSPLDTLDEPANDIANVPRDKKML
jgi:integrase/recombinase XerD